MEVEERKVVRPGLISLFQMVRAARLSGAIEFCIFIRAAIEFPGKIFKLFRMFSIVNLH